MPTAAINDAVSATMSSKERVTFWSLVEQSGIIKKKGVIEMHE